MGMFDTLVDGDLETQVKTFYNVAYEIGFGTCRIGGDMKTYYRGDTVPLETIYYRYPGSFYVWNDESDLPISVIRDGKFDGFLLQFDDATEFDQFYDHYGYKINVSDVDGIKRYVRAIADEYAKPHRNFSEFRSKWHIQLSLEHHLGELIECWGWERIHNRESHLYDDIAPGYAERARRTLSCVIADIEKFRIDHPALFDEFLRKWEIVWEDGE